MHIVHVLPVNVQALDVEFFHSVSAPEESIQCTFELKISGIAISPAVSPEKTSKVNCTNALPLMIEVVTQVNFHCCPLGSVFCFGFFPARSKFFFCCGFLACFVRAGPQLSADK